MAQRYPKSNTDHLFHLLLELSRLKTNQLMHINDKMLNNEAREAVGRLRQSMEAAEGAAADAMDALGGPLEVIRAGADEPIDGTASPARGTMG